MPTRGHELENKSAFKFRDLKKSDLDELLVLLPKCFAAEFAVSGFDPEHMKDMFGRFFGVMGRTLFGLARLSGNEQAKFFVAEADGRIVGTTFVSVSGKICYIGAVMVHPDYRKRGIATALVRNAIDYSRKRKMHRAILDVVSTNDAAKSVYARLGFEEFERTTHLIGDTQSISIEGDAAVETRRLMNQDVDDAFALFQSSDEPNHLRIYETSKSQLKDPFWVSLFHIATQKRIVAVSGGKVVGYVSATYTTPKEAGNIGFIRVKSNEKPGAVEMALVKAAVSEIMKGGVGRIRLVVPENRQEFIDAARRVGFKDALTLIGMHRENLS